MCFLFWYTKNELIISVIIHLRYGRITGLLTYGICIRINYKITRLAVRRLENGILRLAYLVDNRNRRWIVNIPINYRYSLTPRKIHGYNVLISRGEVFYWVHSVIQNDEPQMEIILGGNLKLISIKRKSYLPDSDNTDFV